MISLIRNDRRMDQMIMNSGLMVERIELIAKARVKVKFGPSLAKIRQSGILNIVACETPLLHPLAAVVADYY